MNLRSELYELATRHRLDACGVVALLRHARLTQPPAGLAAGLPRALAALAALLCGLGLVFAVASQWDTLPRVGKFALLQGLVVATVAAAVLRPSARAPLALLALLAIGALLAFLGQTYQTGADPWHLFAWWAALAMPLALAARSDLVWAPWTVVATAALSLWFQAHTAHTWRFEAEDMLVHGTAWATTVALAVALGPAGRAVTGAGVWTWRLSLALSTVVIAGCGVGALFAQTLGPQYAAALGLAAVAWALLASHRAHDLFGLCVVTLGLDVLLVAGLLRWLTRDAAGPDPMGVSLSVGVFAALMLGVSVAAVMRVVRARQAGSGS